MFAALAFVLGAVVGSFLNVCIVRWPEGGSVVRPPSKCPKCGRGIRWYENVPIVGWIGLRGKCAGCGLPISPIYPAVELAVALSWLACALAFGPTFEALRVAMFGTVLLGIAATDARHYLIPDGFTVFLLLWQLGTAIVAATVLASSAGASESLFARPYDAFVGALVGAGLIAVIGWLGEGVFGREAMGQGDITMMAGVGAALGPERAMLTVFAGAFVGAVALLPLVIRRRFATSSDENAASSDGPTTVSLRAYLTPSAHKRALREGARVEEMSGGADDAPLVEEGATMPLRLELTPNALQRLVRDAGDAQFDTSDSLFVPFGVFLAIGALVTLLWGRPLIDWYLSTYFPGLR